MRLKEQHSWIVRAITLFVKSVSPMALGIVRVSISTNLIYLTDQGKWEVKLKLLQDYLSYDLPSISVLEVYRAKDTVCKELGLDEVLPDRSKWMGHGLRSWRDPWRFKAEWEQQVGVGLDIMNKGNLSTVTSGRAE
jgi:hypothetical protein